MEREFRDALLNPKLVFRPAFGGSGAFAAVALFTEEIVVRWGGTIVSARAFGSLSQSIRSLSLQIEEDEYLVPFEPSESDFFNHSCDPNCGLQGARTLIAIRPIAVGEQLTYDYAMSDGSPYDEFDCYCGATSCRRKVRGTDWQLPDLQSQYQNLFSPYLARRISNLKARA